MESPTDTHLAESNLASAEALVNQRRETVQRASRQPLDRVRRHAIVGAKPLINEVAKMAGPFVDMEIGTFDADGQAEALSWLDS